MTLCRIMQDDFKFGYGRFDEVTGAELYEDGDLAFGIQYAEDWLREGRTQDLIGDFDLAAFRQWCEEQLGR